MDDRQSVSASPNPNSRGWPDRTWASASALSFVRPLSPDPGTDERKVNHHLSGPARQIPNVRGRIWSWLTSLNVGRPATRLFPLRRPRADRRLAREVMTMTFQEGLNTIVAMGALGLASLLSAGLALGMVWVLRRT